MSKGNSISLEEWVSELAGSATDEQAFGQTAGELAATAGKGKDFVLKVLRVAQAAGRLELTMATRKRMDGRKTVVPVYRILPKE